MNSGRIPLGRLVGFIGLLGTLVLVASLALLAAQQRDQIRADAQVQLDNTAYLLADHAGRLFEVSDVALRNAAALVQGRDWDAIERSRDLHGQLKILSTTLPYVEDVWLNDPTGQLRLTSFAFPTPSSNAADREPFHAIRQPTDGIFIGDRIIGRVTKRPTFLLARRLSMADGSFFGMVSVTADLRYFNDYWSSIPLPREARVTLMRTGARDILAQHPLRPESDGFTPERDRGMVTTLDRGLDAGALAGLEADRRVGAFRTVTGLPLVVAVSVPEAALTAQWLERIQGYGVVGLAALGALMGLTIMGFRQAVREQETTRSLEAAQEKLEQANVGLEAMIAERTADLRSSEARFRLILESATDYGIVTTDLAGNITEWNVGATRLLGWLREEAIGQHVRMIYTVEDCQVGIPESELGRALADGRTSADRWHRRRDGTRFFAAGALLPMRSELGLPVGFLKILRDRTREFEVEETRRTLNETLERLVGERTAELAAANDRLMNEARQRAQAEEQLRQSQKMEAVGRLTGGVAHDFNNLLTVVTGNLDMLRRRLADHADARTRRLVELALEGSNRAAALTHRLLAFSRQQPLAPEPIDANRLVQGMSDLLQRTLGEQTAVKIVLAAELWRTHADPNQLENAILNLAVNARDAMPDGGTMTIETANVVLTGHEFNGRDEVRPGQYVMVAVSDTGTGMSPDIMAQAFEPFFTTKEVGRGTGLGLSQVYGFAKQSQGHVAIVSEMGVGTTLRIYLPRYHGGGDEAAAPAQEPRSRPTHGTAHGETILVIEDEQMVREFSSAALEEAGYRVVAAPDASIGLALLDANPGVSLLFTDVMLPGPMNGRAAADEALRRRPDLKVLFTTGYTRDAIVHHGRLDEGLAFIAKPFTADTLTARIRLILDRSS